MLRYRAMQREHIETKFKHVCLLDRLETVYCTEKHGRCFPASFNPPSPVPSGSSLLPRWFFKFPHSRVFITEDDLASAGPLYFSWRRLTVIITAEYLNIRKSTSAFLLMQFSQEVHSTWEDDTDFPAFDLKIIKYISFAYCTNKLQAALNLMTRHEIEADQNQLYQYIYESELIVERARICMYVICFTPRRLAKQCFIQYNTLSNTLASQRVGLWRAELPSICWAAP